MRWLGMSENSRDSPSQAGPSVKPNGPATVSNLQDMRRLLRRTTGERVRLRRHDEIVPVQTADLVSPPGHRNPPPLRQQRRVMALSLGQLAHAVSEGQRLDEVRKGVDPFEPLESVSLHHVPVRDLRLQLRALTFRN